MRYNTPEELLADIDKIIDRKVKHYKTDWTKIDRPTCVCHLREMECPDILIARDCGTYLLPDLNLRKPETEAIYILSYYLCQESDPVYYEIDYKKRSIIKRKPEYVAQKYGIKLRK